MSRVKASRSNHPLALLVLGQHAASAVRAQVSTDRGASHDYVLTVAESLDEAVRHLRAARFDGILVDQDSLDPSRLGKLLSPEQSDQRLPVIAISATDLGEGEKLEAGSHAVDGSDTNDPRVSRSQKVINLTPKWHRRRQRPLEGAAEPPESDNRFRNAFEAAGHGIGFVGLDGRWLQVNEAMCKLVGYSADELRATDYLALSHPDDRKIGRRRDWQIRAGKISRYQLEKRYIRRDGTEVPVLLSVSLVRSDAGEPFYLVAHVVDMTEQRRAEALLKGLMYAIDANPIGTFFASLAGQLEYANAAFSTITGYAADSAVVTTILRSGAMPPAIYDEMWDKVLEGSVWQGELRASRQNGAQYWVDLTLVPIRDRHGAVQFVAGFMADVTEWKLAEASLKESNTWLHGILDNVGNGIIVTDHAGRIEKFNSAATVMFGYEPGEVIGQHIGILLDDRTRSQNSTGAPSDIWQGGTHLIHTGKGEITCRHSNGKTVPAELSVNEVSLAERNIRVAVLTDLTERKNAERQLHQAQKMEAIGQLTGGIAHDFNNVLGIVLAALQLLQRQGGHDAVLRDLVNHAMEATLRGADLTKRLLAFSRRQDLAPKTVDVNRLLAGIETVLRRTLPGSIEISTSLDAFPATVMVDPSQLESALLNLAVNAGDAMCGVGTLSITTMNVDLDVAGLQHEPDASPGAHLCISVADNGPGIPRDILPRIFEPFFTTKEIGKGSGLGLSMVYGFVRQSGGHISVESEEGKGARFSIYLPCQDPPDEMPPEPEADEEQMPGGQETILLVEDDQGFRRMTTQLLEELGYVVVPVREAWTALRVLKTLSSVDLLLTDVVLPGGMNGRELARRVQKIKPALPVLLTSGYPRDAFLDGRDFLLLAKPYTGATLARAVREALDAVPEQDS